ncbi:MAG: hypothetical protein JJT94_01140 [Bernardetiaceae bacterium]|nr:hypothetical protein [Bernardetiaceae bacterium]
MNIQNSVWYVLFIGLLLSGCASSKQSGGKDGGMQLNVKKGDSFTVESFIQQDIAQEIMGMKQEQKTQTKITSLYEVLDVMQDGNMKIKQTYKSMMISSESMAGNMSYDSEKDEEVPDFAQAQGALVGQSYTFTVTPTGKVVAVEGGDKLIEAIMANLNVDDDQKEAAQKSLEAEYGEEKLKSDISTMFSVYTSKTVKVGDSWTSKERKKGMMSFDMEQNFTLTEIKDGIAYIDVESKLNSLEDAEPTEMGGMMIEYNIKGNSKGKMQVDTNTGWIIFNSQNQDMGGDVNISGPQTMSIPMTVKMQTITKTLE